MYSIFKDRRYRCIDAELILSKTRNQQTWGPVELLSHIVIDGINWTMSFPTTSFTCRQPRASANLSSQLIILPCIQQQHSETPRQTNNAKKIPTSHTHCLHHGTHTYALFLCDWLIFQSKSGLDHLPQANIRELCWQEGLHGAGRHMHSLITLASCWQHQHA